MANKKLLIVEDEPNIVLALRILLKDEGYEISYCYDGATAIENIDSLKPDLVLLDVVMPGVDGFTVAKYIRNNVEFTIPILYSLQQKVPKMIRWKVIIQAQNTIWLSLLIMMLFWIR
jgi:two-component system response regulator VicR